MNYRSLTPVLHDLDDNLLMMATMMAEAIKMAEIKHIISDFSSNKARIHETFLTLQEEKQDLEEMHQILEEALFQANRRISEKSAHFAEKLKQNITESENRLNQTSRQLSELIEKKTNHLSLFIQNSKKALNRIQTEMQSFETGMNRSISLKMDEVMEKQSAFQQSVIDHIAQTVIGSIGKESNRIINSMENSAVVKIDEYLSRQDKLMENMTQQFNFFEKRIAELKVEMEEIRNDQRRREEKLTEYLKKMSTKQSAHQHGLKQFSRKLKTIELDFGEKITVIETKQQEAVQKKRFWFFRKKPQAAPST